MKINNINCTKNPAFASIYRYKIDSDGGIPAEAVTRTCEDYSRKKGRSNTAVVRQYPEFPRVLSILNSIMDSDNLSCRWLQNHFNLKGIKVKSPEQIQTSNYDVFLLAGDDAKDYKKYLKQNSQITKAAKKLGRMADNSFDRKLLVASELNRLSKNSFDKFIANREIKDITPNEAFGWQIFFD